MAIAGFQQPQSAAVAADSSVVGKGILYMVGAVSLFAIQNAVVKDLVSQYPVQQVVFFRYFFGLIPVLLLVGHMHSGLSVLRTSMLGRHIFRGLLGVGATTGIFYGFRTLPLAEATSIAFVTPIFITVLGVFLLKEAVGWRRWSAILVGLGGVLIILRPGAGVIDPAALIILAACLAIAVTLVMSRQMSRTECPASIAFHFTWVSALVSGVAMIGHWQTPNLADLSMFLLLGLLGGIGLHSGGARLCGGAGFDHRTVRLPAYHLGVGARFRPVGRCAGAQRRAGRGGGDRQRSLHPAPRNDPRPQSAGEPQGPSADVGGGRWSWTRSKPTRP